MCCADKNCSWGGIDISIFSFFLFLFCFPFFHFYLFFGGLFDKLGDLLYDMGDEIGAEKAYREGTRRAPAYSLFPHISPPIIHLVEGAPIDTKGEDTGEVLDIAKVWCLIERAKAFSGDVVTSEFMQALSDISVCLKDGDDGNLIALFANLSLELDLLEGASEDFANKQGADN